MVVREPPLRPTALAARVSGYRGQLPPNALRPTPTPHTVRSSFVALGLAESPKQKLLLILDFFPIVLLCRCLLLLLLPAVV